MYPPRLTVERARELRRRLTLPEVILWQAIGRQGRGRSLSAAASGGPYILDFYCEKVGLAVEVDGQSHNDPDQMRHDARRTVWLGGDPPSLSRWERA